MFFSYTIQRGSLSFATWRFIANVEMHVDILDTN